MGVLAGILGFPRKNAGEVGRAVAGRLLRFATNAGRVVSSLVSVDASGNLSTPGSVSAGISRAEADGSEATFGDAGNAVNRRAFRQRGLTEASVLSAGTVVLYAELGDYPAETTMILGSDGGAHLYRGAGWGSAKDTSAVFQVDAASGSAGGFLPPRLTTTQRDTIATPATGLLIYNTTAGRWEGYNGSAWVGLTTET